MKLKHHIQHLRSNFKHCGGACPIWQEGKEKDKETLLSVPNLALWEGQTFQSRVTSFSFFSVKFKLGYSVN